nr:MAG TPA: hypothetical protein [Caudoviricetes sp.]
MQYNKEMNYKELCQQMNEAPKQGGKQRNNQLAKWGQKYEIEKIGKNKYIIKRQLSEAEIMAIQDGENYSKYLQAILLKFIASSKYLTTIYTYRDFREHLQMVNSHYFPVKYDKEEIMIKEPFDFRQEDTEMFKDKWFDISDAHDKYAINYALEKLKKDGLLSSCEECYIFYKKVSDKDNNTHITQRVCTKEEKATIDQIKLDFIKSKGAKSFKDIFIMGPMVIQEYYLNINHYVKELGFDRYAKAFSITRPINLECVVDYFSPKFNKIQVTRYLDSKRFKTIPPFIHQQLTEKLIRIE